MRRTIQITLISLTGSLWIALAFLIIRQRILLKAADPMSDTGLSFGYGFLTDFAVPGLLGWTVVTACVLGVMRRGSGQ